MRLSIRHSLRPLISEGGTFLAILFGTIAGGVLAELHQPVPVSAAVLATAVLGFLVARFIPAAPSSGPAFKLRSPFVTQKHECPR